MYRSRTAGAAILKKCRTDPSKKLVFERSISKLGHVEESELGIRIINKDSFSDAMGIEEAADPPPASVTELYLDEIGFRQIIGFNPDEYPDISDTGCSFLAKLHILAIINEYHAVAPREEKYIDTMAVDLMKAVKYDDGREFNMLPGYLRLSVGNKEFIAKTGRVGRQGTGIVWVMQVVNHLADAKKGDVQLTSCMIAAYQDNVPLATELYPERMMGVKIIGDSVYFYSMKMSASYLDDLFEGAPNEDIEVFKYPSEIGLCISVPKDRRQIINHLWSMRCYAARLNNWGY